jgi:manganese/iron transport system permease protein
MPFEFDFMQRAFVVTAVVAVPMALLSCLLVLRGWSLMGDAISHAVLPGIVVAYWLGAPLALGAFAAGMVCAGATGFVKENSRVKEDTAMGIVFSGMFALGVVLYVATPTDVHLDHILFGDALGVTWPPSRSPSPPRCSSAAEVCCCTPSTLATPAQSACRCACSTTACSPSSR